MRIYRVIVASAININPNGKLMKFMPGECHDLPEHLGKLIFAPNSSYANYFSLVEIVPPYEKPEPKSSSLESVLEAPDTPSLNDLSVAVPEPSVPEPLVVEDSASQESDLDSDEKPKSKRSRT